jgi:HK97 family phage portal protein
VANIFNPPVALYKKIRQLWGGQAAGIGVFYLGGGPGGAYIGHSWDFTRIANSVYGNPTGFRCVEAISYNFSRPPWTIYPSISNWPHAAEPSRAITDHPLLQLLNHPNPSTSGTMMQRLMARDLELTGKTFWFKEAPKPTERNPKPKPTALRRLPSQRVTVVGNQDDELLGFVYTDRAGNQVPILPENLLYLRFPHVDRVYDGIAPALVAGLPAETDTAGSQFNRELLRNDTALPGYLVIDNLSVSEFAEWKSEWETQSQPGKTRFIGGQNSKYFKVGQSNQELTYSELRSDSQDDILRGFGVPPAAAFKLTHETYANAAAEQAMFMQQGILPKWILACDEMTLQFAPDFPETSIKVALDLTGIDELQDSRDAVVERGVKLMLVQAKTINEFRAEQGLPPVAWGDTPQVPLQQMSAVPMEPPGSEGTPGNSPAPESPPNPKQVPPPEDNSSRYRLLGPPGDTASRLPQNSSNGR